MSAPVVDGNGAVTGHIISTTIGGKNGEPKQVAIMCLFISLTDCNLLRWIEIHFDIVLTMLLGGQRTILA